MTTVFGGVCLFAITANLLYFLSSHLAVIILGTHNDKSAMLFWSLVTKLQLQGHPIVAWKFCHVVHKILREGHPNVSIYGDKAVHEPFHY